MTGDSRQLPVASRQLKPNRQEAKIDRERQDDMVVKMRVRVCLRQTPTASPLNSISEVLSPIKADRAKSIRLLRCVWAGYEGLPVANPYSQPFEQHIRSPVANKGRSRQVDKIVKVRVGRL